MSKSQIPDPLRVPNKNHVPWLLRRIWDRLNEKNGHFMGVIVGEEGSGKSHTALKIAHTVDPTFDADRVIFDISDLLERIKDHDHEPGQFFVLDEAGVQLGRRTWQERGQVLANQALQLIRNHNLGLIFTLPRLYELDSQSQGRLQAFYELTDKVEGSHVAGKWKWMDPDRSDQTGTIYKKYPRRRINGSVMRIKEIAFSPPDESIIEPYEERKKSFQADFYEETIDELRDEQTEDDEDDPGADEIADELESDGLDEVVEIHNQQGTPYISKDAIVEKRSLTHAKARRVKEILESRELLNENDGSARVYTEKEPV